MSAVIDFSELQLLSNRAFARWVPRVATNEWLREVSGESRFVWDLDAMQAGFLNPLYEIFNKHPERWRPVLAAGLMQAADIDAALQDAVLAALELQFLSSIMLTRFRNGRTAAEAQSAGEIPLAVIATVSYTARQYAATLVIRHAASLSQDAKTWLACRFGRVTVQGAAGAAYNLFRWKTKKTLMDESAYLAYLRYFVSSASFVLSADCAIAAAAPISRFAAQLQEASASAGIAYHLAAECETWRGDDGASLEPGHFLMGPNHAPDRCDADPSDGSENIGRWLALAKVERDKAEQCTQGLPRSLRAVFLDFLESAVDAKLTTEREAASAK